MNSRAVILHSAMVAGLCAGLWLMLIKPTVEERNRLEADIREAGRNSQVVSGIEIEKLGAELQVVKRRVGEIAASNEVTRDTSYLYGIIMEQASRYRIHIKRLDPGTIKTDKEKNKPYEVTTFDMTLEGELDNVINFIDGISRIDCYLRPMALNITPVIKDKGAYVQARLACETYNFILPETLAMMVRQSDDEQ